VTHSNRNGGKYDGTMGVVTALEVCRLNEELGPNLPLQLVSFLEEEGSVRAVDDGRSFRDHERESGYEPERWQDSIRIFDDLVGWIERHIEQARVPYR